MTVIHLNYELWPFWYELFCGSCVSCIHENLSSRAIARIETSQRSAVYGGINFQAFSLIKPKKSRMHLKLLKVSYHVRNG